MMGFLADVLDIRYLKEADWKCYVYVVDGSEIRRENHLGCFWDLVNNGINQPQLVNAGYLNHQQFGFWYENTFGFEGQQI